MFLSSDQTKQLLNGETTYDCRFATHKFAYEFFRSNTSSLGSIIAFEYPTKAGNFEFKQAINLCLELPGYNYLAAVCFGRLYLAQLGSIVSNHIKKDCFVNENSLFIENNQASIVLIKTYPSSTLIHITIPTKTKNKHFSSSFSTVDNKIKTQLIADTISSFDFLTKSVFLETQHNVI